MVRLKGVCAAFLGPALLSTSMVLAPASGQAQAQTEKAQEAIGIYASVVAVSVTCAYEVPQPTREAVDANIKALSSKAALSDQQIDAIIKDGIDKASARKGDICRMNKPAFEKFAASQIALASEAGTLAGVPPIIVPGFLPAALAPGGEAPPLPTVPPGLLPDGLLPHSEDPAIEQARQLLIIAHLVEAVSDECEIDLTDDETGALEKAQLALRGSAGIGEQQVNALTDVIETEVEKHRREFCAPRFGFRAMLKAVIDPLR